MIVLLIYHNCDIKSLRFIWIYHKNNITLCPEIKHHSNNIIRYKNYGTDNNPSSGISQHDSCIK